MARKDKKKKEEPDVIEEPIEPEKPAENDLTVSEDADISGLTAIVRVKEEIAVEQNHDANLKSLNFNGNLSIENPSNVDRIWDLELNLKNIEGTDLDSTEILIRELGTEEDNNSDTREFNISGEAKSLLIVKEYINTLPNADDILNFNDIETDLINLKDKIRFLEEGEEEELVSYVEPEPVKEAKVEEKIEPEEDLEPEIADELETAPEPEPEPEPEKPTEVEKNVGGWLAQLKQYRKMEDGGVDVEVYSLESFGISLNTVNKVHFAIGMRNLFQKEVTNVKVVKELPSGFENISIINTTHGVAEIEENQLIWNIDKLASEITALVKFTAEILVETLEPIKTGIINIDYVATSSFTGGIELESFKATTGNSYHMDILEQDDAPGVWDCSLVFNNTSEFKVEIVEIDIHASSDPSTKFITLDIENLPKVGSTQEWQSDAWTYESENFPSFKRTIDFRVIPELLAEVSGSIAISEVQLILASITGEVAYEPEEIPLGVEEVENVIPVNSYTDTKIETTLSLVNNGSAPLNEVSLEMGNFSDVFQSPKVEEVKLLWDGAEIEIPPEAVSVEAHSPEVLTVALNNLKDSPTGMLKPNSKLDAIFPVHAIKPTQDAEFKPQIIYKANTFPLGQPIEFIPPAEEVPEIKVVHIRRKFRKGKEIIPVGAIGNYQIVIYFENVGNVALRNLELVDKVLDSFTYGEFSLEPEKIADEKGVDILSWKIESIEPAEKLEITYDIHGEGEYSPKDAQLAL